MVITLLLFGVTGMTGRHVLIQALNLPIDKYRIICYVRNPNKIENYDLIKSRMELYQGDFHDDASVSACIVSTKPDFIIVTCSLGYTNNISKYLNKYLIISIMNTLKNIQQQQQQQQHDDGSPAANACHVLYLSGSGAPNPPVPESFNYSFIMWLASVKGKVNDNNAVHNFLYTCPKELNYTVVKMGRVSEGITNGTIIGKICNDDMRYDLMTVLTTPIVKFCDVATFLISLVQENNQEVLISYNQKYLWMEYTK